MTENENQKYIVETRFGVFEHDAPELASLTKWAAKQFPGEAMSALNVATSVRFFIFSVRT